VAVLSKPIHVETQIGDSDVPWGRIVGIRTASASTGNAKDRLLIPEFDHQHRPFLQKLTAAGSPLTSIPTRPTRVDAASSRMRRRRMPLCSARISPAPPPAASSQPRTATASCPKPGPDICYDYAGVPAVAWRECVIRLTTQSTADRRPGTNAFHCIVQPACPASTVTVCASGICSATQCWCRGGMTVTQRY
jgi:hypothetical protein